ncbi:hypothetical protein WMZ97_02925 [Lentibacillus sp. N15]|uniref:hypothetical protein n=1 Tax=Lentibacillus songyuanensis TaxID=3136161 RepID=UPI0031BA81D3
MIIPITGNVAYPITLDPTVWIFDERKILLEDAFVEKTKNKNDDDELKQASERFDRAISSQFSKPPVNPGISRREGEKILKNSYVMPIKDFAENAESAVDASRAILVTTTGDISITLEDFTNGLFLFAINGKPLKEDGPVHFFYHDGSNETNPIKNIKKIVIE